MLTFQDFEYAQNRADFIARAIQQHKDSALYRVARDAEQYDRARNVTVNRVSRLYDEDNQARLICSNEYHRLNTQRCAYLLGNGASFTRTVKERNREGVLVDVDVLKRELGEHFDADLYKWAYDALLGGVSFAYWAADRIYPFPVTELCPLWDEETNALRAAIRFWQLEADKPLRVELYTEGGIEIYASRDRTSGFDLVLQGKQAYQSTVYATEARGEIGAIAEGQTLFPVIPMYPNRSRQSTLIELQPGIDSYDLVNNGFARTERDVATIYWLISNHNGMTKQERREFLRTLRDDHIAAVDGDVDFTGTAGQSSVTPYTQEPPWQSQKAYLDHCRQELYQGFGALDLRTVTAGATNDHIDAAYQALDEEADALELCVVEAVQAGLRTRGIEDTPHFQRNRVKNITEMTNAVMAAAQYLGPEGVINHLPYLTVDERPALIQALAVENMERLRVNQINEE